MDDDEGEADREGEAVSIGSDIRELCAADDWVCARRRARWRSGLETSLYASTLQGEPLSCLAHFTRQQIVAGLLPLESHFRAH